MTASTRKFVIGLLLVWSLGTVWWASRPIEDHVPTGAVEGEKTTEAVDCHSPLSRDSDVRGSLPRLEPPRAYERRPCAEPMRSAGYLLALDAVFLLAAGTGFLLAGQVSARRVSALS